MSHILFLCIGNSNIIGDSLGPLVGSFLQTSKNTIYKNANIDIIGTMNKPLGYQKIDDELKENIASKKYSNVIIIDSALGNEKNIGKILINDSKLCAGNGVNIGKNLYGDTTIRGIVGKNHNDLKLNILELNSVSAKKIERMADKVIAMLEPILN